MNSQYKIITTKQVEKFIRKQDKATQKRIAHAIFELPAGDIKKLKGYAGLFRLRVGDIRVILEKNGEEYRIILIDIGNRGQIYNKY
ncbi:MAG: plasmid stabilization protein [Clostridia bacterium]|jgi:mRNA interferase RelE/StbE|nr:plasmid stabilization protein [Clostridia bacterium]